MEESVKQLTEALRNPKRRGGFSGIRAVRRTIAGAERIIRDKVRAGTELYEYEKWLYENYFFLEKTVNTKAFACLRRQPRVGKAPRISLVADYITEKTGCRLSRESVSAIISEINETVPLFYGEMKCFKQAVILSLAKKIADAWERAAAFCIDEKCNDGEFPFYVMLAKNLETVSAAITSVRNIDDILSDRFVTDNTYAHKLMCRDTTYCEMDFASQKLYLQAVDDLSNKKNISERAVIERLFEQAEAENVHFGEFLFKLPKHGSAFFIFSVILIDVFLTALTALLFRQWWGVLIAVLFGITAYFKFSEYVAVRIAQKTIKPRPIPKLGRQTVPDDAKTVVAVSHLIKDAEGAKKAVFKAEKIAAVNKDDNIIFALLVDLAPANSSETEADDSILDYFKSYDSPRIKVFVRKRTLFENRFCGHERKRGAIMDFNDCITEKKFDKFRFVSDKNLDTPQYVVLLDADSEVLPGGILNAVNTVSHPLNKKYDLMTFGARHKLHRLKTFYSLKYFRDSGAESYPNYSDFYYNLSGHAVYCGKGIYRLTEYRRKLTGALPCGKVLSHDIIEGALLETGSLSEVVYEDAPLDFIADTERQNRWHRGDIQLLPFLKNIKKTTEEGKITLKKHAIYNYIIISNVLNIMMPAAFAALLIAAAVTLNWYFAIPFAAVLLVPFCWGLIKAFANMGRCVRVRYTVLNVLLDFWDVVFRAVSLPFYAINNLLVLTKTFYRMMFSKRHLLDWKTFSVKRRKKAEKTKKIKLNAEEKEMLTEYAKKTYGYFAELSNEESNYLVTDNIQLSPNKGEAEQTSPTNIGFLLLSHVSAAELGFISKAECEQRIEKTVTSLERLEKYSGNLFNWFNHRELRVLEPKVISSVDSANFLACLTVCAQYVGSTQLKDRLLKLIEETDLSVFYDEDRGLYHIAVNTFTDEKSGHYDLLASESRLLTYLAVAKGGRLSAWGNLSRHSVSYNGNTMLSWSGTAFEYLLPQIFLPDVKYSLITRSVKNAVKLQVKNKCQGVFGISESAYYKFDESLKYQYRAFGLEELSLRREFNKCVISPYSSFLALQYNTKATVKNLSYLKNHGGFGRYGFFEAIDYTNGKNIIYSHMAHHQGMSLASVCNLLCGEVLKKLFMSAPQTAGAELLLSEKQTEVACPRKYRGEFMYERPYKEVYRKSYGNVGSEPEMHIIAGDGYKVLADHLGNNLSAAGDTLITRFKNEPGKNQGIFAYLREENGEVFSPSFAPLKNKNHQYETVFGDDYILFENTTKGIAEHISMPSGIRGEVRKFVLKNDSNRQKKYDLFIYGDLSLNTYEADYSHKTFDSMFVSTEFFPELDTVVAKRNSRSKNGDVFAAMTLCSTGKITPETNKMNFLGRLRDCDNPKIIFGGDTAYVYPSLGDVLEPCFGAKARLEVPAGKSLEFYSAVCYSASKEDLLSQVKRVRDNDFFKYAEAAKTFKNECRNRELITNATRAELMSLLVPKLVYWSYGLKSLKAISEDRLFDRLEAIGLNKYLKTFYHKLTEKSIEKIADLEAVIKFLNYAGVWCNLVIEVPEGMSLAGLPKEGGNFAYVTSGQRDGIYEVCFWEISEGMGLYRRNG